MRSAVAAEKEKPAAKNKLSPSVSKPLVAAQKAAAKELAQAQSELDAAEALRLYHEGELAGDARIVWAAFAELGAERLRRLAGVRLLGFKANASRKPPDELAGLDRLDAEAPERLAAEIVALRDEFGMKVLGGCCGTDDRHIGALAGRLMAGGC